MLKWPDGSSDKSISLPKNENFRRTTSITVHANFKEELPRRIVRSSSMICSQFEQTAANDARELHAVFRVTHFSASKAINPLSIIHFEILLLIITQTREKNHKSISFLLL